jgi:outer membrane protein OmpA-like peptidoglycan-associated protein
MSPRATQTRSRHAPWRSLLALILLTLLVACATPSGNTPVPYNDAIRQATDELVSQTKGLPNFLSKIDMGQVRRVIVVDPMVDAASGQQSAATKSLEKIATEHLTREFAQYEIASFQASSLARASYLLTGVLARDATAPANTLRIHLALTDLKTRQVVGHGSALALAEGVDISPTPYFRDSPVVVKDKVVDGYVRTTQSKAGEPADATYIERIATSALVNDATTAYNNERYGDALGQYQNALSSPAGEQLRVLNGVYMSQLKLGRMADAEKAFGKVVAFGIANDILSVKFLFAPGNTEFWSGPGSGPYTMWVRQIAREAANANVCMKIVGHTSRTGSEQTNDRLSLQRANEVKQKLDKEVGKLSARTTTQGMGFRENLVGIGTDNAADAPDRRVEFRIQPCH